ncbi:MAG: S9 family peptidase [Bryobacteraceae bacterium]
MLRPFLLLLAFTTVLPAAKKPVTIDALLEKPGRRGGSGGTPIWAPDGKRFITIQEKKAMLYDVPAKSEKELLSLDPLESAAVAPPEPEVFDWQNRRVSEESVQWSGDGKQLLISAKGDLFLFHLDSRKWDQLTATAVEERDAKLSPDGKRVAFRRDHDLYTLDVASKDVTQLTHDGTPTLLNGELDWVYPEELDLGTAWWWSPDSQRIAYMQFDVAREFVYPQVDLTGLRAKAEPERYPQAGTPNADVRLGVIGAAGGQTCWMDLGETRGHLLARVYWTPDSKQLAVERFNRVQDELNLLLADASTGAAKIIIHETDRSWINVSDEFRFLDGAPTRFLWSSERDGFRHLYLYSLDGKQINRVTAGNWEVSEIAGLDENRGMVYYVSTEASPLERQLYSVRLDGQGKTRISQGPGTHSISMSPTTAYYMDTFSNLTTPPAKTLYKNDGSEWAVYKEPDRKPLQEYEILPSEIATLNAADGTPLYARIIKPANFDPHQKYPAIVMVYGGPGAQSIRNSWAGLNWDQVLAHKGFLIWALDNRGSTGRGHAFEAPLYRRLGKVELEDQLAGVKYLIAQGFVDAARIGIYGWSYGGFMTLNSLFNAPDVFKAGIAGAPVTNWHNYDTIYTERYLGTPAENEEGYRASSAVTYADKLKSTLLVIHNIEDDNVLFQNSAQLFVALEKANRSFAMVPFPQKTHGVTGPYRKDLLELTTGFFEKNLK